MAIFALTFVSTAPANAGTEKVDICHATGLDGKYVQQSVSKDGTADGHAGTSHQDGQDIIPAFDWIDKNNVRQYFDGQNLNLAFMLDNGCNSPTVPHTKVVDPIAPIFTDATCLNLTGTVTAANQPEGVTLASGPVFSNGTWTTTYTANKGYEFSDGTTSATFTNVVVPAGVGDPNFIVDSKTGVGQCEMPNTGGGINDTALMIGGGALGLGMIFLGIVSLLNRRQLA